MELLPLVSTSVAVPPLEKVRVSVFPLRAVPMASLALVEANVVVMDPESGKQLVVS